MAMNRRAQRIYATSEGSKPEIECEKIEIRVAREKKVVDELTTHVENFESFLDSNYSYECMDSYDHKMYLYATVEMLRQRLARNTASYENLLVKMEKNG